MAEKELWRMLPLEFGIGTHVQGGRDRQWVTHVRQINFSWLIASSFPSVAHSRVTAWLVATVTYTTLDCLARSLVRTLVCS